MIEVACQPVVPDWLVLTAYGAQGLLWGFSRERRRIRLSSERVSINPGYESVQIALSPAFLHPDGTYATGRWERSRSLPCINVAPEGSHSPRSPKMPRLRLVEFSDRRFCDDDLGALPYRASRLFRPWHAWTFRGLFGGTHVGASF